MTTVNSRRTGKDSERGLDKVLSEIVDEVAKKYGLSSGTGKFTQFRYFQTKWERYEAMTSDGRENGISLEVTDYLKGAPEFIIREFIDDQIRYIVSTEPYFRRPCSDEFLAYLDSNEFIRRARKLYFIRGRTIQKDDTGALRNAFSWLLTHDLVPESATDALIRWDCSVRETRESSTNILLKVVEVPVALREGNSAPGVDLIWLIYRQLCKMATPFDPFTMSQEDDCKMLYEKFPKDLRKDAERRLQMKGLWDRDMYV